MNQRFINFDLIIHCPRLQLLDAVHNNIFNFHFYAFSNKITEINLTKCCYAAWSDPKKLFPKMYYPFVGVTICSFYNWCYNNLYAWFYCCLNHEYTGPKLYKQPATKSNRGIILNAVEYCVFPGVVNRDAKQKVLDKINRSEAKHFLILFRDAGCQFRALYSYWPENESVIKLYGTGPSQVDEFMFDKFFK